MNNLKRNIILKTLTILCVFVSFQSFAQVAIDWDKNFDSSNLTDYPEDVVYTADKGYVMTGATKIASNDNQVWVIKVDSLGNTEWEKKYGGSSNDYGRKIIQTSDGGYLVGAISNSNDGDVSNNNGLTDIWLIKIDNLGNIEWEKNYGGSNYDKLESIVEKSFGGFAIVGKTNSDDGDVSFLHTSGSLIRYDIWVISISPTGFMYWEKTYGGTQNDYGIDIIQVSSGFLVLGNSYSNDGDVVSPKGLEDIVVLRISFSGTLSWFKNYGGSNNDDASEIIKDNNNASSFIIGGSTNSNDGDITTPNINGAFDFFIAKINLSGTLSWSRNYGHIVDDKLLYSLVQKTNNNLILGGDNSPPYISGVGQLSDCLLKEVDYATGDILWQKTFGGSKNENLKALTITENNQLAFLAGSFSDDGDISNHISGYDFWLVKLKQNPALINGTIFLDENENCINDNIDTTLTNVIVVANSVNSNDAFYGLSNSIGNYALFTDTVSYNVSVVPPSPYWGVSSCQQDTQLIALSNNNNTINQDFYLTDIVECPYMVVDINNLDFKKCDFSTYYISYCNNGTVEASNAYIEIDFDPSLVVISATIPWSTIQGNTYTFPLGNIDKLNCGSFSVETFVSCNNDIYNGQILCTKAHIFPDTICLPGASNWTGAELEAKAECINSDTVELSLKNVGLGNMGGDITAIAIEDIILIMDTFTQLNSGNDIKWRIPTNGIATHRIVAQQPPSHPFKTFTTAATINCAQGTNTLQSAAYTAYPNDEEASFLAIDCQPIVASSPAFAKTVSPTGVSSDHFITEKTDLEYKIKFQNLGNETAKKVIIIDSVSRFLDVSTFVPGASSHTYQYDIYGNGVVKFTFENILLPDSNTNDNQSHGFVTYKIKQKTGNQSGDIITSNTNIFFDYNLPISTNTAFSEIGGIFIDTIIYKFPEIVNGINTIKKYNIKTYPNPATDFIVFELNEKHPSLSLEIYDLQGKIQQKTVSINSNKIKLNRGNVSSGTYIFKLYTNQQEIAYGKIIFK